MLPKEDILVLKELKRDSRQGVAEIAKKTGLSGPTVSRRINYLLSEGYIKQFTIVPDWEKLDRSTLAYVLLTVDYDHFKGKKLRQIELAETLRKHPMVFDASTIAGPMDIILKVRAKDMKDLDRFIDHLRDTEGVRMTETKVVFRDATRHDNPFDEVNF